ncbi:hypothetical protein G9A89_006069 [Geosiphon pyriformis]|nr:hypothetical protein G9A89_006069 [Geosiphon pyriformis]
MTNVSSLNLAKSSLISKVSFVKLQISRILKRTKGIWTKEIIISLSIGFYHHHVNFLVYANHTTIVAFIFAITMTAMMMITVIHLFHVILTTTIIVNPPCDIEYDNDFEDYF